MTLEHSLQTLLEQGLEQMELTLAPEQSSKLVDYVLLLAKWNKTHNLTAVKSPQAMISRHILDSLTLCRYLGDGPLLDVGAGAGLPGIPLAIVNPELSVTLVDSVRKKTRFMEIAAATLALENVSVLHTRVESLDKEAHYSMVTARAFTAVMALCELTERLISPGGRLLAMIGQPLDHEHMESLQGMAGFSLFGTEKLCVPGEQGQRNLLILERCP